MSTDDRMRWNHQHLKSLGTERPSAFLREILESDAGMGLGGTALDIACGKGRNAIYLAQRGFAVTALDISAGALAEGRRRARQQDLLIDWHLCDLEASALAPGAGDFDLIINFNYLQRSLFQPMRQAVKPGGHVIFETYLIDQAAVGHPKNPDYLLRHNELLECFGDFRVLFYREGVFADGEAAAFRAGIFARRIA
ncbi:MAG: class I SAM-dependent methyltransferase [Candidatus Binatia bacterium]